jgi:virginiamycin A acetyltransferase
MLIKNILTRLYAFNNSNLRNYILKYIAKMEGGILYSSTIRIIFREYHYIDIGMYTYGGCFSPDNVPGGTSIGRYCSFAEKFRILDANHPAKFKSLHPFFFNPVLGYVDDFLISRTQLMIGNDVWVGHAAIILPSVMKIENGAIIGAGCVVTENVPPYAVVVGNPGRVIKYRFDEKTIDKIQQSKWWEKNITDIKADLHEFSTYIKEIE